MSSITFRFVSLTQTQHAFYSASGPTRTVSDTAIVAVELLVDRNSAADVSGISVPVTAAAAAVAALEVAAVVLLLPGLGAFRVVVG